MRTRKLKFGMIADPISSFHPEAETSFFILREITRRGYECRFMEMRDLYLQQERVMARAAAVQVESRGKCFSYKKGKPKTLALETLDCLFLRKDPPVDEQYFHHLTLLELLEARKTSPLFINSPSGIKKANEKIYPLHFPGLSPATLVSQDRSLLLNFVKTHGKAVVKPLNSSGGRGVFILKPEDPGLVAILEESTRGFTAYVMAQKYLPEAKKGDKRILLLNGTPLGAFLRVPRPGDFRGNMHQGAKWVRTRITIKEEEKIRQLKARLLGDGLYFVGLDCIGDFITEINVTSPMGIREINALEKIRAEETILDWVEKRVKTTKSNER